VAQKNKTKNVINITEKFHNLIKSLSIIIAYIHHVITALDDAFL